jgi:branched-chain amino acid transport system ATP-binding protein
MEVGRIVMDGTAEALMNSEDIQNFYLGVQEEGARQERRWKRKKTWR